MTGSTAPAAAWEFPYEPLRSRELSPGGDLLLATTGPLTQAERERVASECGEPVSWETVLSRAPLFWTRLRGPSTLTRDSVTGALERARVAVRYVAPTCAPSSIQPPPLSTVPSMRARASDWRARDDGRRLVDAPTASRWFLDPTSGLDVDRARCGTGAGTRLAVIDDDGAEAELVGFEREVRISVDAISRISPHGSLMAGWAVGALGAPAFPGVAPGASPRLYVIPKPGIDVVSLPHAIAQAVFDGADVVVCATYIEQTWSPMLDDALSVAVQLGRRGRGTAVVLPCGREGSSPPHSVHASWSLSLGDPASDPRVFCIGPSGRHGGWFLWHDRRGKLRPFANRGPAVRWLAPGDDLADPLELRDRWCHAESSGASALAAGVLLLVLASNPKLTLRELESIVTATASPIAVDHGSLGAPAADPFDLLPHERDADGHNAKHGYGRMNARRACLAARDPICAQLLAMGEDEAAVAAFDLASRLEPYSARTARWIVRRLLADATWSHGLRVVLRHLRLVAGHPERAQAHAKGALARQLLLLLGALSRRGRVPPGVSAELEVLATRLADPQAEPEILRASTGLWLGGPASSPPAPPIGDGGVDPEAYGAEPAHATHISH